jgi:hypothetical protein
MCLHGQKVSNGVQKGYARVVETPAYLKAASAIFSEAEMAGIVTMIAADPDCGDGM